MHWLPKAAEQPTQLLDRLMIDRHELLRVQERRQRDFTREGAVSGSLYECLQRASVVSVQEQVWGTALEATVDERSDRASEVPRVVRGDPNDAARVS